MTSAATGTMLDAAIAYARAGLPVFPILPNGKKPAIAGAHPEGDPLRGKCHGECGREGHGFHDATVDEATIRRWWARWPTANIGLRTGLASGIDVLDPDVPKPDEGKPADGREELARLEHENEPIQAGPWVECPTGGAHVYFRHADGVRNSESVVAPSIDVRGDGGYVVVPPSRRAGGEYVWRCGLETPLPAWPAWLLALAMPKPRTDSAQAPARAHVPPSVGSTAGTPYGLAALKAEAEKMAGAANGTRNATLNRAAFAVGQLLAGGELRDEAGARAALVDAARSVGLEDPEIEATMASGLSAGLAAPRNAPPRSGRSRAAPAIDSASGATPDDDVVVEAFAPFPLDLVPPVFADSARNIAAATNVNPAVPIVALLACAGAFIGNSRWLQVQPGWEVPPSLWIGVVAESGSGKSPGLTNSWRPAHEVERPHVVAFREAWTRYESDLEAWRAVRAAKGRPQDGARADDRDSKPTPPEDARVLIGDATGEALVSALARCSRGLLVADTELRTVLEGCGAYKAGRGNDEAWLLKAHDGEPIRLARKHLGPVGIAAERPLLSLIGALTPSVAARVFGGERMDSGMTGRFLLVSPPTTAAVLSDVSIDRLAAAQVEDVLKRLRDEAVPLDAAGAPEPRFARLDAGAREVFREAVDRLAFDAIAERGGPAAVLSKARGLCARLSLIVHCVRVASGEVDAEGRPLSPALVDVESVHRGCGIALWLATETLRVGRSLWGGESLRTIAEIEADALEAWARRTRLGEPFAVADVRKGGPVTFRRTGGGGRTRAAIEHLVRAGRLTPEADGKRWRTT